MIYISDKILNSKPCIWLMKVQKIIMVIATLIMLSTLGIVVFMRYVLHEDFFGYDEIALISSFWMYFIGSSYAMYEEAHVKADILARLFSVKIQRVINVIAGVLQTSLSIYLTFLAYKLIVRAFCVKPITASYSIPFYVPQMSILTGCLLMTLYLILYTIRDIQKCFTVDNSLDNKE